MTTTQQSLIKNYLPNQTNPLQTVLLSDTKPKKLCQCSYHQKTMDENQINEIRSTAKKYKENDKQQYDKYIEEVRRELKSAQTENGKSIICEKAMAELMNYSLNYIYGNNRAIIAGPKKILLSEEHWAELHKQYNNPHSDGMAGQKLFCCRLNCLHPVGRKISIELLEDWKKRITDRKADQKSREIVAKEMLSKKFCKKSIEKVTKITPKTCKNLELKLKADQEQADQETRPLVSALSPSANRLYNNLPTFTNNVGYPRIQTITSDNRISYYKEQDPVEAINAQMTNSLSSLDMTQNQLRQEHEEKILVELQVQEREKQNMLKLNHQPELSAFGQLSAISPSFLQPSKVIPQCTESTNTIVNLHPQLSQNTTMATSGGHSLNLQSQLMSQNALAQIQSSVALPQQQLNVNTRSPMDSGTSNGSGLNINYGINDQILLNQVSHSSRPAVVRRLTERTTRPSDTISSAGKCELCHINWTDKTSIESTRSKNGTNLYPDKKMCKSCRLIINRSLAVPNEDRKNFIFKSILPNSKRTLDETIRNSIDSLMPGPMDKTGPGGLTSNEQELKDMAMKYISGIEENMAKLKQMFNKYSMTDYSHGHGDNFANLINSEEEEGEIDIGNMQLADAHESSHIQTSSSNNIIVNNAQQQELLLRQRQSNEALCLLTTRYSPINMVDDSNSNSSRKKRKSDEKQSITNNQSLSQQQAAQQIHVEEILAAANLKASNNGHYFMIQGGESAPKKRKDGHNENEQERRSNRAPLSALNGNGLFDDHFYKPSNNLFCGRNSLKSDEVKNAPLQRTVDLTNMKNSVNSHFNSTNRYAEEQDKRLAELHQLHQPMNSMRNDDDDSTDNEAFASDTEPIMTPITQPHSVIMPTQTNSHLNQATNSKVSSHLRSDLEHLETSAVMTLQGFKSSSNNASPDPVSDESNPKNLKLTISEQAQIAKKLSQSDNDRITQSLGSRSSSLRDIF